MRSHRSLPQFALAVLLETPIALSLGAVNFPPTVVAQAQTREDQKAEGDRFSRLNCLQ